MGLIRYPRAGSRGKGTVAAAAQPASQDQPWHYAIAGALLVGGPLASELYYARYPFGSTEALILVAGLAVTGAAIAVAGSVLGRYLSAVVFTGLFALFLDFEFEVSLGVLGIAAAGCVLLSVLLRRRRAAITIVTVGAFYLSSLPFRSPDDVTIRNPRGRTSGVLRPIVHVVLDEQLGIGGFRGIGDSATADFLTDFYVRRGFDVYPSAYSRFNDTRPSIASLMSLGEAGESSLIGRSRPGSPAPLVLNPYFARLAGAGYRISVYQSANLEYCATARIEVATCIRVPPTSVANISYLGIPWREKARLVLEFHLVQSSQLRLLHPRYRELESRRIFAARGLGLLRSARDDVVRQRSPTDFRFVHVLLPHGPYEVDAECVSYLERRLARSRGSNDGVPDSLRTSRAARYRAQVRCTHRALGQFLDRVDEVFGRNQAVMIVHGDHGSRAVHRCEPNVDCKPPAATADRVGAFRPIDFNSEFSALLAVRGVDSKGTVHWETTPVQDLLWAFIKSGFKTVPPTPWAHYIYLNSSRGRATHPLRPTDMLWSDSGQTKEPANPGR